MRKYCTEATAYGNVTISVHAKPTNVLVVLNPTANKRSAQKAVNNIPINITSHYLLYCNISYI